MELGSSPNSDGKMMDGHPSGDPGPRPKAWTCMALRKQSFLRATIIRAFTLRVNNETQMYIVPLYPSLFYPLKTQNTS